MDEHSADESIYAALNRDDPIAVELIWDRYAHDLLAMLSALLGSRQEAEDVLQMLFVNIVRRRRALAGARRLDAYLFRMARNEAATYLRSRIRNRAARPWLAPNEAGQEQFDLAEHLQVALGQLPQSQREVVVLKIYQGKTFQEIGRLLGVSINTAASRYRYALERLRSLLKDVGS